MVTIHNEMKTMEEVASILEVSKYAVSVCVRHKDFSNLDKSLSKKKSSGGRRKNTKDTET